MPREIIKRIRVEINPERQARRDLERFWKRVWRIAETEGFIVTEMKIKKKDKI